MCIYCTVMRRGITQTGADVDTLFYMYDDNRIEQNIATRVQQFQYVI
jgi:hypothetical protein